MFLFFFHNASTSDAHPRRQIYIHFDCGYTFVTSYNGVASLAGCRTLAHLVRKNEKKKKKFPSSLCAVKRVFWRDQRKSQREAKKNEHGPVYFRPGFSGVLK